MKNLLNDFKMTRYIILALILIGVLGLHACSSKKSQFIGKWQRVGKQDMLEFFSDGRLSADGMGGNWTILNDGQVKLEVTASALYTQIYIYLLEK